MSVVSCVYSEKNRGVAASVGSCIKCRVYCRPELDEGALYGLRQAVNDKYFIML